MTVDGQRVTLRPHAGTDTVADLAVACDREPDAGLWIDGMPVAATRSIFDCGLRVGSAVAGAPITTDSSPGELVEVAVIAGPSCDGWRRLGPGRRCIGRSSTAGLRLDDPAVELHHAVIDVGTDGSVTFTQLTGRIASRLDGVPCETAQVVAAGESLQVGASRLTFRHRSIEPDRNAMPGGGSIVDADNDPWRRVVQRGPSQAPVAAPMAIPVPEPPRDHRAPPLTGLVGAGVAVAGAGLMAAVLGQVMFAFFAAIGAVASLATWGVGAIGARRGRRRAASLHRDQLDRFIVALHAAHARAELCHRATHRPIVDIVVTMDIAEWERRVWERRADQLNVTLGQGTVRWTEPIGDEERAGLDPDLLVEVDRCEQLTDVAVPIDLPAGRVLGVHGDLDPATALVR
ncbi:MAG: hypothetical protein E4H05_03815, partial [Acidimicrobiales bacterium]